MFKTIVTASVSVLLLTLASAAGAKTSCQETADTNYAIAVAIDYADADMVHENTIADCETDEPSGDMSDAEFHAWLIRKAIRDTAEGSDARRWTLEAIEHTLACPNGHYDFVNDVDVCE